MIICILTLMLNLFPGNTSKEANHMLVQHPGPAVKRKLIVFSGSDWCKNCILFKEEVLSSDIFKEFAKNHIEIITADFPQRIKLPKETIARNEALAEQYNPQGEFPRLVLLSSDGNEGQVIPFQSDVKPQHFVDQLKDLLEED